MMSGAEETREGRTVTFTLPCLPRSCNSLYQILYAQRRVELRPDVRRFKNDMKLFVPRFAIAEGAEVRVDMAFYFDLKKRRMDSPNLIKVIIDLVAEKLGFNDRIVRHGSWKSVHDSERESVVVTMTEVVRDEE